MRDALDILINIVLSIIVFIVSGLITAILAGWLLGSTKVDGHNTINGGAWAGFGIIAITLLITILFSRWFATR